MDRNPSLRHPCVWTRSDASLNSAPPLQLKTDHLFKNFITLNNAKFVDENTVTGVVILKSSFIYIVAEHV
jgi:hypothetical protein